MPPLDPQLRRRLENTVVAARGEAEAGARAALEALAVAHHEPYTHMKPEARALRNHLRARARQLGDVQSAKGELGIDRLAHECAYEHWHRMLFARFLAENNLLIDPDSKVAVSLAECEELAKEEGVNTWEMAARFAQAMLPQIFRVEDPLLKVTLPTERRVELETLLANLPQAVFTADDSLGWVYQFWQRDAKDAANDGVKSGAKIDADTLPAVTQLFTEHYMVLFLLHNTIGAWWAAKQISAWPQGKLDKYGSEAELRAAVALPGYTFDYLRFVKGDAAAGGAAWRPAAGSFTAWPRLAKELTVLDPSCGSGHFLVSVLELLARLRIAEEGLSAADAVNAVLKENLFGLELDQRCTQIAAFNVALAAWKLAGGKHIPLPDLHLACSGMGPNCTEDQWVKLAETRMSPGRRSASPTQALLPTHGREAIRSTLRDMHALFSKAPELGSLIDPTATAGTLGSADWETVKPFLTDVMAEETGTKGGGDSESYERAVAAQGMAKAAEILSGEYALVITNVPYLARGKHSECLRHYADHAAPHARQDLATLFIWRTSRLLRAGGVCAVVSPSEWLYLQSYADFRKSLLASVTFAFIARLGFGAFSTPLRVSPSLCVLTNTKPELSHQIPGLDFDVMAKDLAKHVLLQAQTLLSVAQNQQLRNADCRLSFNVATHTSLLNAVAEASHGQGSFDGHRFSACHWEIDPTDDVWEYQQSTVSTSQHFSGCTGAFRWEGGAGQLAMLMEGKAAEGYSSGKWRAGTQIWGQGGVMVSQMGDLPASLYLGRSFDENATVVVPKAREDLAAVWCFCSSDGFSRAVREIDTSLKVTCKTVAKVAFDLAHWRRIAEEMYPDGLPLPQSDDPTQWLYHGHPAGRVSQTTNPAVFAGSVFQVAVARLAGYRWPAELDPEMRLAPEARAWVEKCKDLAGFADDDGVIPIVPMRGEPAAEGRVRDLLRAAFGMEWTAASEVSLLSAAAASHSMKSPAVTLDDWLKNRFFAEHCELFLDRPFVWHIWDGRKKDGFGVLVHYHRLAAPNGEGRRLLEKITHGYLGDWIARQRDEIKANKAGADARLAAALDLQKKLEAILAGEPPYDIFVRWKPLHEQPIGWEPDINDGVRMNIRPFVEAGVLRDRVNVKWKTDRGQEPKAIRPKADFPWFWNGSPSVDGGFTGDRVNDIHLTVQEKQKAREAKGTA